MYWRLCEHKHLKCLTVEIEIIDLLFISHPQRAMEAYKDHPCFRCRVVGMAVRVVFVVVQQDLLLAVELDSSAFYALLKKQWNMSYSTRKVVHMYTFRLPEYVNINHPLFESIQYHIN